MTAHKPDYLIFILVAALLLFGLVMVFSASFYSYSLKTDATGVDVLRKQVLYAAMGMGLMIITFLIPYRLYGLWRIKGFAVLPVIAVAIAVGMLALVLLRDADTNGAKRWLKIGPISVQPSEIGRFAMVLFVSDEFARKKEDLQQNRDFGRFLKAFAPSLVVTGAICVLILAGSNLSMTAATGLTFLCLCFALGINRRFILWMVLAAVLLGVAFTVTKEYRMKRALSFMDPFADPTGDGYQVVQSLYALGAGGLTGVGLGESTQKFLYLTYSESDFILAIIGEELGLIGLIALLAVYGVLVLRGMRCANRCPDMNGLLLATGYIMALAIQLLINVAVCTSSMPPTGVPLPLISSGGSSMIIFMIEMGVLLNVSRYTMEPEHRTAI